jgi:hypothetical protein
MHGRVDGERCDHRYVDRFHLSPTTGAALVWAGLLSVMIFPALAVSRLPKRVETAGATDRVAIHSEAM